MSTLAAIERPHQAETSGRLKAAAKHNAVPSLSLSESSMGNTAWATRGALTSRSVENCRSISGPATSREPQRRALDQHRREELKHRHQVMLEQRKADEQKIEERRARAAQLRQRRLEESMAALQGSDGLAVEASDLVRDHEDVARQKRHELHAKWDQEVYQRVEYNIHKHMMQDAALPLIGVERPELLAGDDPLKSSFREIQDEEAFHRRVTAILRNGADGPAPDPKDAEAARRRRRRHASSSGGGGRPMMPAEIYSQPLHNSLPYSFFVGSCADGFRSCRQLGGHLDESDNVRPAGRLQAGTGQGYFGTLERDSYRWGQAASFKTAAGASCAAPCQDHYQYERSVDAVDAEFPKGKRTFTDVANTSRRIAQALQS